LIKYLLYLKYLEEQSESAENASSNLPSIAVSNLTVDNELLYHGRRYDSESNLYYYRARYYDPILGRFLSTDPMGYKDSMNLYQAFNMNGYNFVDPSGLTKVFINITRERLSSDSIIGTYNISLDDLFTDLSDFVKNISEGYRLYQRAKRINGYTLEDKWERNRRNISSIPIGSYEIDISYSGMFKKDLPEFQDVPGNRNYNARGVSQPIRIHSGNNPGQIQGCILIGNVFNQEQNENWIGDSRNNVIELMNFISDVKKYDKKRGENTEIQASINLNIPKLFRNFIDRIKQGKTDSSIFNFLSIIGDMAANNADILNMIEKAANRYFDGLLEPNQKIIFRTIDTWEIETSTK